MNNDQMVADALEALPATCHVFHEVRVARTRTVVDHLVVCPGGIVAIEGQHDDPAKHGSGTQALKQSIRKQCRTRSRGSRPTCRPASGSLWHPYCASSRPRIRGSFSRSRASPSAAWAPWPGTSSTWHRRWTPTMSRRPPRGWQGGTARPRGWGPDRIDSGGERRPS